MKAGFVMYVCESSPLSSAKAGNTYEAQLGTRRQRQSQQKHSMVFHEKVTISILVLPIKFFLTALKFQ
jgi:hypothetical protein